MIDVPAAMTISGTLAWVASGADRKRGGGDAEAGDDRDLVVDDQFLGEALGVVGDARRRP